MEINLNLLHLYYKNVSNLKEIAENIGDEDTADYEGPLLMKCFEENYSKAKVRILFVGQETNGWMGFNRIKTNKQVDEYLEKYVEFSFSHSRIRSTFWQTVHLINNEINQGDEKSLMWTNILKFGRSGKGRPDKNVQELELKYFNILEEEIKILQSDCILFLSGPSYDFDITQRIRNVLFQACSDYSDRELSIITSPHLPKKTFRIYHPNYLRYWPKESRNQFIKTVVKLLEK